MTSRLVVVLDRLILCCRLLDFLRYDNLIDKLHFVRRKNVGQPVLVGPQQFCLIFSYIREANRIYTNYGFSVNFVI